MEFFIILEGSCGVYYRVEMKDEHKFAPFQKKIKKEKIRPLLEEGNIRFKSNYPGMLEYSKIQNTKVENRSKSGLVVYHKNRMMEKVVSLLSGSKFGDMSLKKNNKSGRRMATIVTDIDTQLLVLDRDSYLVRLNFASKQL
jgi:CRP-like cAMP-binding protein